jgi:peptide/nickel transport system ATP-binding protein
MSKNILEVRGLKTYYKTRLKEKVHAVDGVDFVLEEGKTLGIAIAVPLSLTARIS